MWIRVKPNTMMGNKSNTLQRLREIKFIPINVIVIFQQTISYHPLFLHFTTNINQNQCDSQNSDVDEWGAR